MDDYITDAQLAEALEAFEATPVPFIPTCFISSGFCPSSPLVSTACAPSSVLSSSSASGPPSIPNPLPTSSSLYSAANQALPLYRYALPKTDEEVNESRISSIPKKTLDDTKYCFKLFEDWRKQRQEATGGVIGNLCTLPDSQIQHWMSRFILEVRKRDGNVYTPNTLHHITAGVMRHLRWNGRPDIDFFRDSQYSDFRQSLDAEMKRLQSLGIGSKKKQAEVLTEADEDLLWAKGLLGGKTPKMLLDTVVFYNGLYFALRSGREHRQLRHSPCQIEVMEKPGERPYLLYHEDTSKNHPGGLKGRKTTQKVVVHHSNSQNPDRCFVTLFKKYRQLCPDDPVANAFYLQPSRSPTETCWYTRQPLG